MFRLAALMLSALLLAAPASALEDREGWRVHDTGKTYETLLADLKDAIKAEKMGLVTEAGPTEAAASQGVTIPGNRVVGVFRPDFAVRALEASEASMIEAPIRFYVTENADGTATLSYKTPGHVFAPYAEEGGEALAEVAAELDAIFEAIAARAVE
ncbi:MAG: DUF302 domain-containing protein [Pseudomonadota bacterium]